ncbi:30778_t:CDS:2, partial [Gigaspora margarita]
EPDLSTDNRSKEFKKFAATQNEKVSGKDKEIAQLLKTDANIVCIFRCTIELHNWLDNLQVYKYQTRKRLAVTTKQEEVTKENNSKGSEIKAEEVIDRIQQHQSSENNNPEYRLLKKTEQTRVQSTSSQNKQYKIVKKDKEYSADDISINMHEWTVTTKQEKGKAKQAGASVIQGKENCEILVVISQILTRLNKLEEQQEKK